ncbi:MAG TPA: ABC transporter ATP-binding protein [Smithellaceae bacterium]|jgi:branched-chain amino acid transport system ATP-binding protein|nr:ABC transporter ATP-binding protein [Smithellaceae bacterium]
MLLRTDKICKYFGGLKAVDEVDFTLKKGQLKSIIGPNGAGKTTLFNLIAGAYLPTKGKVFLKDKDISRMTLNRVSRLGVVKTYQINHIFPSLTVFENLRIAAQVRKTSFNFWRQAASFGEINEQAEQIMTQVELKEKRNWPASTLSHGERRYLEIGIALATEPEVLLLDEPTAGMSCAETNHCAEMIQKLNTDLGLSIVLVEHDMSVVMSISEEILVMNEGRTLAEGTPREVSDNEEVQRVYLG